MDMFMLPVAIAWKEMATSLVQKGAAWLDENEPGWVQKIVPSSLDLSTADMCICGQVFGDYGNRPSAVEDAAAYGFCTPDYTDLVAYVTDSIDDCSNLPFVCYDIMRTAGWAMLDRCWLDEIYWRTDWPTEVTSGR